MKYVYMITEYAYNQSDFLGIAKTRKSAKEFVGKQVQLYFSDYDKDKWIEHDVGGDSYNATSQTIYYIRKIKVLP